MTTKFNHVFRITVMLLAIAVIWPLHPAQSKDYDRRKFYDIKELSRLIQKAKEAGFSDKDIEKLVLQDADESININEYIREMESEEKIRLQKLQEFSNKKFLTIGDIYKEMIKLEPNVLINLREELVSDR